MLSLFLAFFFVSIIALFIFLIKLPEDLKKRSIRPIFFMLVAIAFWIGSLPILYVPDGVTSTTFLSPYNITTQTTQLPSPQLFNNYFYVWLTILIFMFFLLLLWWLMLLRAKAMKAADDSSDVMAMFDKQMHGGG